MKLKKPYFILLFSTLIISCSSNYNSPVNDTSQIASLLDSFNSAAARADFNTYFSYFTTDAIFVGTDAHEHWNKQEFMNYAKPYFDKGKAWNFHSIDRHIYFDKSGNTVWFDELLDTRMKICRGSGLLTRESNGWKIRQYVLSMTIPNIKADSVIKIKAPIEDTIIARFSH